MESLVRLQNNERRYFPGAPDKREVKKMEISLWERKLV